MNKLKYYLKKLKKNITRNFSYERIKKYGIRIAILNFIIFLMHRNNTNFEHWIIRKKDIIVQKYIYLKYQNIIDEIREETDN